MDLNVRCSRVGKSASVYAILMICSSSTLNR